MLDLYVFKKTIVCIFSGLHALHSSGFVHGDIKPTNLLWCAQDGCLKLVDFGLSFHYQDKVRFLYGLIIPLTYISFVREETIMA